MSDIKEITDYVTEMFKDVPGVAVSFDPVQRPAHYNQSDIECIDAIKASMTLAEFQSYLKGNVLKYLWRYRHKNGLEDVKKAQWYINRLAAELEDDAAKGQKRGGGF